jgi:hypothetical protein
MESARAMLSARATESFFDFGGATWALAKVGSAMPSAQRMKRPLIWRILFVGFQTSAGRNRPQQKAPARLLTE